VTVCRSTKIIQNFQITIIIIIIIITNMHWL